ncbi:hypothetical protein [Helicobacter pylori]|uniref:hypothetical protein n=1 Tax=Helicobacter pylori TaxID=210 RepID=UPI00046DDAF6|nr:hypothetical protein [Helicobacter pylori]
MVDKFVGMADKFVGGWLGVVVLIVLCVVFFPLIMRVFVWFGRFFIILLIFMLCFAFPPLFIVVIIAVILELFNDDDD